MKASDCEIIEVDAEQIGGCSLCGYKDTKNEGHRRKSNWLKQRLAEGLRYKVLRSGEFGDLGMIEYAPASHCWRPVEAEGYFVIHCLIVLGVKHKGQGLGTLLLNSCLQDARDSKCRGVAVVTSSGSLMADSGLFLKAGFVQVERIAPYELLVKKFQKSAPDPRFCVDRERLLKSYDEGLTILAADQCPLVPKFVKDIAEASRALGLKTRIVRLESAEQSRALPTPYGMFTIIYQGRLIADRPISATRFLNIMRQVAQSDSALRSLLDTKS